MTLNFDPSAYLQVWQQNNANQRADKAQGQQNIQQILQGLGSLADSRRQQQLMDMQKQKSAFDQQNEQQKIDLEKQKTYSEYGKPIDPNAMFDQPTGQIGMSSFMPGGRGPVASGSSVIDAHKAWMAKGMPLEGARPEFMDAMGKDERKQFYEQNDPGRAGKEAADTNLKNAQADFYRTGKQDMARASSQSRTQAEQDRLEGQARQGVENLRGDKSLARTEEQRDAAIIAYNRIHEIEQSGQTLNPIDYTDVLGQIYKARTGAAPTEQVLSEIRQDTAQGKYGKWYTYMTGKQAPATSPEIMSSLKSMAASMGMQADNLHEGYMQSHLMKPSGLEDARWNPIAQTSRGRSFRDATGYDPDQNRTQKSITATNPKTGQKIVSNDGGQTWQAR